MTKICGFICLARVKNSQPRTEIFFGKPTDPESKKRGYLSLSMNKFTVFTSSKEARAAKARLEQRNDFEEVRIAKLEMKIAGSGEELSLPIFANSKSLVILWKLDDDWKLIGEFVEEAVDYPLPGSEMNRNGMKPIESINSAKYIAWQRSRQSGGCPALIATFSLKMV